MKILKRIISGNLLKIQTKSLIAANLERGEQPILDLLSDLVPDIENQYSTFKINKNDFYTNIKTRCQHAFQVSLMVKALDLLKKNHRQKSATIVDIGDSSGTHMIYVQEFAKNMNFDAFTVSVNLDESAIDRIRSKGLDARLCRAEDLHLENEIKADIFVMFEVLEHLFDPITFLKNMFEKSECKYFALSVPKVSQSRVGLAWLRGGRQGKFYAENTHIFELSPVDWNLLFKFTGWKVIHSDIYNQYPRYGFYRAMKFIWKRFDYEGFYGVILEKDSTHKSQYQDF